MLKIKKKCHHAVKPEVSSHFIQLHAIFTIEHIDEEAVKFTAYSSSFNLIKWKPEARKV